MKRRELFGLGGCALGAAAGAAPACERPFVVGLVDSGGLAYASGREGAAPAGVLVDVFELLGQALDCPLEIRLLSIGMLNQPSAAAELDGSGPGTPGKGWMWIPLLRTPLALLRRVGADGRDWHQLAKDPAVRFGVLKGANYGRTIGQMHAQLPSQRIEWCADVDTLLRKLVAGRMDVAILAPALSLHPAAAQGIQGKLKSQAIQDVPMSAIGIGYNPARVAPAQAVRVMDLLQRIRTDGRLAKILQRHLGDDMGATVLVGAHEIRAVQVEGPAR